MSIIEFLKRINEVPTQELMDRLSVYRSLQSKGVRDEVMISFLESTLLKRGVLE